MAATDVTMTTSHDNTTGFPGLNSTISTTKIAEYYSYNDPKFDHIMFSIVCPILYCLITLLGIAGNSLVIYVILTRNNMRTVTNLLLLNLAIADITFVMSVPPFTAYHIAVNKWPFGVGLCKLMHYIVNVTSYVTIYTLVLIATVRYMTIVHSQKTVKFRTRTNIVIFMACIWLFMLVINIPVIFIYGVIPIDGELKCDYINESDMRPFFTTFFVFAYALPLLAIAAFSIAIVVHIVVQHGLVDARPQSRVRKRNASRLLIFVIVIFAVLWLPIHVHILLTYYDLAPRNKLYTGIAIFFNPMAYFNSCINPLIYNYYSKEFRDSFKEVLCCCRPLSTNGSNDIRNANSMTKSSPEANGATACKQLNDLEVRGLISKHDTELETIDMHAPGEIYIGEIKRLDFQERKMSYDRKDSCKL